MTHKPTFDHEANVVDGQRVARGRLGLAGVSTCVGELVQLAHEQSSV